MSGIMLMCLWVRGIKELIRKANASLLLNA